MALSSKKPVDFAPAHQVPVHFLGISQIMSYGFLFYAFALLRDPLAAHLGIAPQIVLTAVSGALLIQGVMSFTVGKWTDEYGGLRVMTIGFLIGAIGLASLTIISNIILMCFSFLLIGLAIAMCTYEVAFSTVVQLEEKRSRWLISVVSFYGGVASSLAWITLQPILTSSGFVTACLFSAGLLLVMACFAGYYSKKRQPRRIANEPLAPFSYRALLPTEQRALIILAFASGMEYFTFAAVALFWIAWFTALFGDVTTAVWLAAIYGPFQVVGRLIEMRAAASIDARITGLIAACMTPLTLYLAQIADIRVAVITMMLFGIGHGILTVTFGFVTNLYFRAAIYGRAKGIIAAPRAIGMAIGPLVAGLIYGHNPDYFMPSFIASSLVVTILLAVLLRLKPTNEVHHR